MAKSEERIRALGLRREGKSVKEIAKLLSVSSSSVVKWTRDIELTDEQREFLRIRQIASGNKGRMIGAEMNRQKRIERMKMAEAEALAKIQDLSDDALFYIGLGLYWGEGAKAATQSTAAVVNSDPAIIALAARWFTECFGVSRERFMPRIFISDVHRERESLLIAFWSEVLGIPETQFRKTIFLAKGKKIYENHDTYYGVLALRVAKSGDIRYKILAQIARIKGFIPMPG